MHIQLPWEHLNFCKTELGVLPFSNLLVSQELLFLFFFFLCSSSVQSLSHVQLFAIPWTAARQASLSITNSWSLLKLLSIESVMPSNHLIHCHPLLLLPSIFPSIRAFSNESVLHIRCQSWSSSFSISPYNECSGQISFSIDWLDLFESKGLSRVFSNITVQKHQFSSAQLWSHSHIYAWLLEKP